MCPSNEQHQSERRYSICAFPTRQSAARGSNAQPDWLSQHHMCLSIYNKCLAVMETRLYGCMPYGCIGTRCLAAGCWLLLAAGGHGRGLKGVRTSLQDVRGGANNMRLSRRALRSAAHSTADKVRVRHAATITPTATSTYGLHHG